jgi:hypothetical protein
VNDRIYNNIFDRMEQSAVEFTTTTNSADGNVYSEMPRWGGYLRVLGPTQFQVEDVPEQWLNLEMWQLEHGGTKMGKQSISMPLSIRTLSCSR